MAAWQASHPILASFVTFLALDHVYTSFWFAAILVVFILALLASSLEQIRLAKHRIYDLSKQRGGKESLVDLPVAGIITSAKRRGYWPAGEFGEAKRLVKNPWSYWGSSLLHLGILLVIIASLYVALSRQKGIVQLTESEAFPPGAAWGIEERGLTAGKLYLPDAIRLDTVTPLFWENDQLRQLQATISFLLPKGKEISHRIEINKSIYYKGVRINLTRFFGRTFLLEMVAVDGRKVFLRLDILHPGSLDQPSYKTFTFNDIPYVIKAKYYADSGYRDMGSTNPLLVLRLVDENKTIAELSLAKKQEEELGPYRVRLVDSRWWVGLECTRIKGLAFVFLGFFIIILGVGLTYFVPPRVIVLQPTENGCLIRWYPGRFADCYESELEDILKNG